MTDHAPFLLAGYTGLPGAFGRFGTRPDGSFHDAVDLLANYGTDIYAPVAGTVVQVVPDVFPGGQLAAAWTGGGRIITLEHNDAGAPRGPNGETLRTNYVHLSHVDVAQGDHVAAGDVLGRVGDWAGLSASGLADKRAHYGGRPTDAELQHARALDSWLFPVQPAAVAYLQGLGASPPITRRDARYFLGRLGGDNDSHLHFGVRAVGGTFHVEPGAPAGAIEPLGWLASQGIELGSGQPVPASAMPALASAGAPASAPGVFVAAPAMNRGKRWHWLGPALELAATIALARKGR